MASSTYHKSALKTGIGAAAGVVLLGVLLALLACSAIRDYEQKIIRYQLIETGHTTLNHFNHKLRNLVGQVTPVARALTQPNPNDATLASELETLKALQGIKDVRVWSQATQVTPESSSLSFPNPPEKHLWPELSSGVAGLSVALTPYKDSASTVALLRLDYFADDSLSLLPVISVLLDLQSYFSKSGLELAEKGIDVKLSDAMMGGKPTLLAHFPVDMPLISEGVAVFSGAQIAGHQWQLYLLPSQGLIKSSVGQGAATALAILVVLTISTAYLIGRLVYARKALASRLAANEANWKAKQAAVEGLAVIDSVTGLYNRHHFDVMLDAECRRGVREFMPLTVMNIQVGSFDSFRQTHGNQAANQCLQHVAKALKKAVSRPGDLIALYDAGRFMLLLPSTNEMASSLAERCLETIRSTALSTPDTQQMSVALGIATMEPSTDLTPENVLKLADLALRDAQAKGGDKYVAVVANEKPNDTSYII